MWARTLAPELGARLLMRLNYLEPCLQFACETNLFEWALEISKYGTMEQKREVHYRYAMALEDEGRFAEAEKEFVQAGKAMEAVQMYIHSRDWESAEDIARSHSQEAVTQVLIARAAEAAEAQDYATAETLLLRAHKPEIIIEHYKVAFSSKFVETIFLRSQLFHVTLCLLKRHVDSSALTVYNNLKMSNVSSFLDCWNVVRSITSVPRVSAKSRGCSTQRIGSEECGTRRDERLGGGSQMA